MPCDSDSYVSLRQCVLLFGIARHNVDSIEDEWVWGWDATPGIVSVWATLDGRAVVWRRLPDTGVLVRERERFRPWILVDSLDDLRHLGRRLGDETNETALLQHRELEGDGGLRWLVTANDTRTITNALLHGASRRLGRPVSHVRELGAETA